MVSKNELKSILEARKEEYITRDYDLQYSLDVPCTEFNGISVPELCSPAAFKNVSDKSGALFYDYEEVMKRIETKGNSSKILGPIDDLDVRALLILFHELSHCEDMINYYRFTEIEHELMGSKDIRDVKRLLLINIIRLSRALALNPTVYRDIHHLIPDEHCANTVGLNDALIFKKYESSEMLSPILTYGYDEVRGKVKSPLEELMGFSSHIGISHKIRRLAKNVPLYDRLSYGLPVNSEELAYAKDLKDVHPKDVYRKLSR